MSHFDEKLTAEVQRWVEAEAARLVAMRIVTLQNSCDEWEQRARAAEAELGQLRKERRLHWCYACRSDEPCPVCGADK